MTTTLLEPEAETTTSLATPSDVIDKLSLYHWTPAQYRQMAEVGILAEGEKVELIEGMIVRKMTRNAPHDGTLQVVSRRLISLVSEKWEIRSQSAIITKDSEPEPDLAIVPGPVDRYGSEHPVASEVMFVAEIADSSLVFDRRKASVYARGGVPVYWIVNVADRQLEVFSEPDTSNGVYLQHEILTEEKLVEFSIAGEKLGPQPVRDFLLPVRG